MKERKPLNYNNYPNRGLVVDIQLIIVAIKYGIL